MPNVSYSGQSFAIDGRRQWLVVAGMEYARTTAADWQRRLEDIRDAGFNTVQTGCPWLLHEPRRDHLLFDGDLDLRAFVTAAATLDLKVILRTGPHIGSGFDGGGIPSWITREPDVRVRIHNDAFLSRFSRFMHAMFTTVADLQVTKGGPIIAVQLEDSWACGNEKAAGPYLGELIRIARETGVSVPLLNANNLWTERGSTIDIWQGDAELLANLRQLRTVQPDAPRLAVVPAAAPSAFGSAPSPAMSPDDLLIAIAQVLAAGAQPIVSPFHAGTFFGFAGGRTDDHSETLVPSAAHGAPIGEAGARSKAFARVRRIATFASRFGALFADLDPAYQPVLLNPDGSEDSAGRGRAQPKQTIVPLRGRGGQVIFVFGAESGRTIKLLLEDGTHLPVEPGDQPVAWYLIDADLHGRGRLDYANVCPFALIDQRILVLYGPAGATAILSINGTPNTTEIPSGKTPTIIDHKSMRVILCNEAQIDAATALSDALVIGGTALPGTATFESVPGWTHTTVIRSDGDPEISKNSKRRSTSGNSIELRNWTCCPATDYVDGSAARYATLTAPLSLPACGAPEGYGWYRFNLRIGVAKKRRVLAPFAGPRVRWYLDHQHVTTSGSGTDASAEPFDFAFRRGDRSICALVDNTGRRGSNEHAAETIGITGPIYEVKPLTTKPQRITASPVRPFDAAPFIIGLPDGALSSDTQFQWSFTYAKKSPLIILATNLKVSGTLVVNDHAVARLGDGAATGPCVVLDPSSLACFSGNRHVVRFAPDFDCDLDARAVQGAIRMFETVADITANGSWAFAKWEPPPVTRFRPPAGDYAPVRNTPAWWACRFTAVSGKAPLWLDTAGLGKGSVQLNGRHLGRYFTAHANGTSVGPQTRLLIPESWLRESDSNELLIFDEFGRSPDSVRITSGHHGDLDAK